MTRVLVPILALSLWAAETPAQTAGAARFLEVWDLDGDGRVTADEMARMRGNVFGRFDLDADDRLDAAEYADFDAARGEDVADLEGADADSMARIADGLSFARNDADGDGQVSRAEFIAGVPGWLAELDRDGSGDVGPNDFAGEN